MKNIILMITMLSTMFIAGGLHAGDAVNVNTASIEQLQEVKGVGPKTAEAIVAYRKEHGDFSNVDGLTMVKGIGEKKLKKIEGALTVKGEKG